MVKKLNIVCQDFNISLCSGDYFTVWLYSLSSKYFFYRFGNKQKSYGVCRCTGALSWRKSTFFIERLERFSCHFLPRWFSRPAKYCPVIILHFQGNRWKKTFLVLKTGSHYFSGRINRYLPSLELIWKWLSIALIAVKFLAFNDEAKSKLQRISVTKNSIVKLAPNKT